MKSLRQILSDEIRKQGVISFARFMELALYCPVCGYYEKEKDIGKHGDFITSVSVGNLFGALMAFQFSLWFERLSSGTEPLRIVEAGAHNGALAKDILAWFREHRPFQFDRLQYGILEPSIARRTSQRETLADFNSKISWHSGFEEAKTFAGGNLRGVIFSNELLDAMPVHRFGWDAQGRTWFEWGVAEENSTLVWRRMDRVVAPVEVPGFTDELRDVLPDGYVAEASPWAEQWWRNAAAFLEQGRLVTIDYGSTDSTLSPSRANGTLRAYSRHAVTHDLLAAPGEQDLTAHVNFGAIRCAGEQQGLTTEILASQENFLTGIAARLWKSDSASANWTPLVRRQFQTLTHPAHFGRAFHVLVQERTG